MSIEKIVIHTDGGSRGNPGPAGIGGVIQLVDQAGKVIKEKRFAQYIGDRRTNNEAEYEALRYALQQAKTIVGKKKAKQLPVECFLDSELVVKQLNHQYKLKNRKIQQYFLEIWNLMLDYGKVKFVHLPRELNQEADRLVNQALDQQSSTLF